jgi:hypothetical protein
VITGNTASQQAGAIFLGTASALQATISQSTISGNTAVQQGGGLFVSGGRDLHELAVVDSVISSNQCTSTSQTSSRGGGVYINGADVSLSGSTISGNSAAAGGGVYSTNSKLTINFSAIQGNTASSGNGGGILSRRDRLMMTGSTISSNSASGTGGSAGGNGGGLWHSTSIDGPSSILDTVISGNSVNQSGGGLYAGSGVDPAAGGNLTLTNVTIDGNSATRGGGVRSILGSQPTSGRLITSRGSISNNTATMVGGGVYSSDPNLSFDGTTISGNHAGTSGGGIAIPQSTSQTVTISLVNTRLTNNAAGATGDGGGLWIPIGNNVAISLFSSKIDGNTARRGGGIFRGTSSMPGAVTAIDSTISGNSATQNGGGIYDQGGTLSLIGTSVVGNYAGAAPGTTGGGGIFARQVDVSLTNCSLSGNLLGTTISAQSRGGGLYLNSGDLSVTGTTIAGNLARADGGGVWAQLLSTDRITIQSSTVSGNTSLLGTGGMRLIGTTTIRNSTVTGNTGGGNSGAAGGIFFGSSQFELDHTIVAKNTQKDSVAPDLGIVNPTSITMRFSLVGDNSGTPLIEAPLGSPDINGNLIGKPVSKGGNGIIDARLGPLANNGGPTLTHALLPASPAIDAGVIVSGPPLGYDQRGVPFSRAVDGNGDGLVRIDIGAYESQGLPNFSPGDYNQNGIVDAADYTKWRDSLQHEVVPYSGADGNGSGRVDQADFELWKTNFGHLLVITPPAPGGGAASVEFQVDAPSETAMPNFSAPLISEGVPSAAINRQSVNAGQPVAAPAINDTALLAWLTSQSNVRVVPNESASVANQAVDEVEPLGRDPTSLEAAFESIGDGFETLRALAL